MHFNFIGPKKAGEVVVTHLPGLQPGAGGGERRAHAPGVERHNGGRRGEAGVTDCSTLDQLSSKRRMTVLTEELERQTRAQSQFEESFYKLAVRLQSSRELADLSLIRGATKRNLILRRLNTERERLSDLGSDMLETVERMKLIAMHMKVIRFAPSEEALHAGRDECVAAITDFVRRAERCLEHVLELREQLDDRIATLSAAAEADAAED